MIDAPILGLLVTSIVAITAHALVSLGFFVDGAIGANSSHRRKCYKECNSYMEHNDSVRFLPYDYAVVHCNYSNKFSKYSDY